jgi:hypothetical protein
VKKCLVEGATVLMCDVAADRRADAAHELCAVGCGSKLGRPSRSNPAFLGMRR